MTREQIETSGLNVYTTVDKRMQRIAEETITETVNGDLTFKSGFQPLIPAPETFSPLSAAGIIKKPV